MVGTDLGPRDCRHLTRRLEGDLLAGGEAVLRVPARLMAEAREGSRQPGKSDPIDALAVARAALREPGLPVAKLDGPSRQLRSPRRAQTFRQCSTNWVVD